MPDVPGYGIPASCCADDSRRISSRRHLGTLSSKTAFSRWQSLSDECPNPYSFRSSLFQFIFLSAEDTSPAYYSLCTSRVFVNLFSLHVSSATVKILAHYTLRPQPSEFFLAHCTLRPQPPHPAQPAAESATVKLPS